MNSQPFLRFHRAAEARGYPALLVVSSVALALMVAAIALLSLTLNAWAFAVTQITLIVSGAFIWAAINAALADDDNQSDVPAAATPARTAPEVVVPLMRRGTAGARERERRAA
jgi:hypothetical protein